VSARQVRALLERGLDELSWIWCWRISLLIDAVLAREQERETTTQAVA
jgi:hypothetical protein